MVALPDRTVSSRELAVKYIPSNVHVPNSSEILLECYLRLSSERVLGNSPAWTQSCSRGFSRFSRMGYSREGLIPDQFSGLSTPSLMAIR